MLKAKEETRPACRWSEHKWQLQSYVVFDTQRGSVAAERHECPKCGRFQIRPIKERE